MANRLADAMSPYLQQHADNPVDWYAWGSEAFAAAKERNVPILLSVGYAACHWCHVMAHESFEDAATAAYMNEHFVNVKVDREEHPDVDSVYMSACVSMTGQGGWPLTCVLDHDGAPFFSGTYFPPRPVHGRPAFTQVLQALSDAWSQRGDEVREVAGQITDHLRALSRVAPGELDLDALPGLLAGAVAALERDFDAANGGFGGAPKFPPSMILDFLARRAAHAAPGSAEADSAQRMHAATCEAMARSGTYDQLGGGFARYAVDAGWVVPHFEKMLYDNAQLLSAYAHWDAPLGRRVAAETADFLLRDLRTDQGGFASSLDADTDGVEGAFYVWAPAELDRVLGEADGAWAAALFGVTEAGTFEHGASTLQLRSDPDPVEDGRFDRVRAALLDARAQRTAPARDDKVVAAWNGLAISGLCAAAAALDEPRYLDAALAAADLLVRVHLDEPSTEPGTEPADRGVRLRRVSRDGRATGAEGVLEDYGCVAQAFGDLAQATGDPVWVDRAGRLLARVRAAFLADDGGFFDTATASDSRDTGQPTLLTRPRDLSDNASPCGASAAAHAFLTYAALTGDRTAYEVAVGSLGPAVAVIAQAPRFAGWFAAACDTVQQGPLEVAVIGEPGPARDALATEARRWPGAVVVTARPEDTEDAAIELVRGRGEIDGHPTAYVCRQQVCAAPVTSVEDLRAALRA